MEKQNELNIHDDDPLLASRTPQTLQVIESNSALGLGCVSLPLPEEESWPGQKLPDQPTKDSPVDENLASWKTELTASLQQLKEFLGRWNALEDISPSTGEDTRKIVRTFARSAVEDEEFYYNYLPFWGIEKMKYGLNLQIYDAVLLYADEDKAFGEKMLERLELADFKICTMSRLLSDHLYEHQSVMRLIIEQCRHVIVIVSHHLLTSKVNRFLVLYAQAMSIELGRRIIIPCIYGEGPIEIPKELIHIYKLDFNRDQQPQYDFWGQLRASIINPRELWSRPLQLTDRRRLAQLVNLSISSRDLSISKLLVAWKKVPTSSIELLEQFLSQLDRWEVIDDIYSLIGKYEKAWIEDTSPECVEPECEENVLTFWDDKRLELGLEIQMYDAILFYADEDWEFGQKIVENLKLAGLEICSIDDLVNGLSFEDIKVLRLIYKRCRHVIIVLSPSFINSKAYVLFGLYVKAMSFELTGRTIITCVHESPIIMPPEVNPHYILDFHLTSENDFWSRLQALLRNPKKFSSVQKETILTLHELSSRCLDVLEDPSMMDSDTFRSLLSQLNLFTLNPDLVITKEESCKEKLLKAIGYISVKKFYKYIICSKSKECSGAVITKQNQNTLKTCFIDSFKNMYKNIVFFKQQK